MKMWKRRSSLRQAKAKLLESLPALLRSAETALERALQRGQRIEQIITEDGPDHEIKDQYFTLADGTGTRWLAHRYDYRRRG